MQNIEKKRNIYSMQRYNIEKIKEKKKKAVTKRKMTSLEQEKLTNSLRENTKYRIQNT